MRFSNLTLKYELIKWQLKCNNANFVVAIADVKRNKSEIDRHSFKKKKKKKK